MSGTVRRVVIALTIALGLGLLGFLGASSARAETTAGDTAAAASPKTEKAAAEPKAEPEPEPKAEPKAPKPKAEPKAEPKADPAPAAKEDSDSSSAVEAAAVADPPAAQAEADPGQATADPAVSSVGNGNPSAEQAVLLPPIVHDHAATAVTGDETNALAVSVDDHPKAVTPGGHIDYDITITNVGTDPATGVVWADLIPKELTDYWVEFIDASNTIDADWTCNSSGDPQPAIVCALDPALALESGDWASFRVHATVRPDTPVGTVIQNVVLADWNENPGEFALPVVVAVNTPVVAKARSAAFFVTVEEGLPLTGAASLAWLLFAGLTLAGTGAITLGATRRR
ncbi:MAG: DUF11 domain-containing protein, partial [Acidimicrobiia bacterium]|nr:DUF11 domain-containing protein [Acidimicrobiia bacterium]